MPSKLLVTVSVKEHRSEVIPKPSIFPAHISGLECSVCDPSDLTRSRVVAVRTQRYISTRPMFIDVRELSAGALGGGSGAQVTDAATAGVAVRDLGQLYKGLLAAVKEEALVMEQVFPSPRTALIIFLQRVFEQRIQVPPLFPQKDSSLMDGFLPR